MSESKQSRAGRAVEALRGVARKSLREGPCEACTRLARLVPVHRDGEPVRRLCVACAVEAHAPPVVVGIDRSLLGGMLSTLLGDRDGAAMQFAKFTEKQIRKIERQAKARAQGKKDA